jgi:ABC-type Na+ efflux pump permease subunit
MRIDKAWVIARREYGTRIRGKGFWISTVALPILLFVLAIVPGLLASKAGSSTRSLAVVDQTGRLCTAIQAALGRADDPAAGEATDDRPRLGQFAVTIEAPADDEEAQRAELDRRVLAKEIDAWMWISSEGLAAGEVEYHSESVASFMSQTVLEHRVTSLVRRQRLEGAGVEPGLVDGLLEDV